MPAFGVPTLEDLPPARRQAGPRCGPTSTSPSRTARSPTTSASAPPCPPSSGCSGRARRSPPAPTSAGPRARPTRSTRSSRCGRAWPSWRPASSCSRTCASTRARRPTTPPSSPSWSTGFDAYVNDAFGASHRAHASIVGPPRTLPSAAGRLLEREVEVLLGLREQPLRPFVAILGGSKVSDKLGVIDALLGIADPLVIGGGMCFTFLAAQGALASATRLLEADQVDTCRQLLAEAGDRIHLPVRHHRPRPRRRSCSSPPPAARSASSAPSLPDGWMGLDIGPGTAAEFGDVIAEARTVLWNGPMGVFEDPRFEAGTRRSPRPSPTAGGFTVVGGGDRAAAAAQFGLADRIDHISTGGGASLELLEQGDLPGLEALRERAHAEMHHGQADPQAAHQRQLEDAPQPLRGDPDGPEAELPARQGRLRRASTCRCTRRSPTSARCRRRSRPTACSIAPRRPALPLGGEGRVHRRGEPGVPGQAQRRAT